jgi:transposase
MVRKSGEDAKERVLREHGTLNPEPGKVEEERFRSDDFFDPRDVVQVKYEMLRQVHREGATVSEAARAFGFSRPTFYHAQQALAEEGVTGLLPKRPGPRKAHKLTDEVMEFVGHLRAAEPVLSAEELARELEGRYGLSVHPRSIERALARREKKHRGSR